MSFRRRANVIGWLILSVGMAILIGDTIWGGRVIADGDILVYYYPVKTLIRNLFLHGHSLVWNPFMGEGQPLAANPEHELFYPFTWLLFAFPVRVAIALTAAAHLALTFGGMLRLLRRLRCSEGSAVFGAISWAFCGLVISSIHLYPIFFAWTWIPWLCAVPARKSAVASTLFQGGLFGGLLLLVGEPVTALLGAIAFAAILLSRARLSGRRLAIAGAAGILAMGVGAASWMPGSALARKTVRASGLPAVEAAERSFPLQRTAELLVPNAFGDVRPHSFALYRGWQFYSGSLWPFFWGIYAGALFLPLTLTALASRRRQELILGGFLAFALIASLGPAAGLWTILRLIVPGAKGVRFPEKFLALALFLGVILAARGLDQIRSRAGRSRWVVAVPFVIGGLLALVGLVPALRIPLTFGIREGAFRQVGIGSVLALVVFWRDRKFRRQIVPLFLAAAALDVATASSELIKTRTADWMDAPPPVARQILRASPPPRVADFLPQEPPELPNFVLEKNGPFDRNRMLDEEPVQWGIPLALDQDFDLTFTRSERRARNLINRVLLVDHRAFGALLAARHVGAILVWKPPVTLEDPVTVAGVGGVRPEVDSVESLVSFRGDDDFVRTALYVKTDLRRAAFLEGNAPIPQVRFPLALIEHIAAGDLEVSFDSTAAGPGFARVARTNDGNWHASVDGRPSPLSTVDISMIGIAVPPGRHHVVVRYHDPWLTAGMVVSGLSLLILVAAGRAALRSTHAFVRSG